MSEITFKQQITSKADGELISNLYNDLIVTIETATGVKIGILRSTMAIPKMATWYPFQALGNPVGYIVRDNGCIQEIA